jgi:hypothetical protein
LLLLFDPLLGAESSVEADVVTVVTGDGAGGDGRSGRGALRRGLLKRRVLLEKPFGLRRPDTEPLPVRGLDSL